MPTDTLLPIKLTEKHFNEISGLVRRVCGINLHDGKKELIKARLSKRLRKLKIDSFDKYLECVKNDTGGGERTSMLDALSTNLTQFFREPDHFEYLGAKLLPRIVAKASEKGRRLRIWSAGCSSGEEPYSLAITVCENIPNPQLWDAKVLATDLSTRMLAHASKGVYGVERLEAVAPQLRSKYFSCVQPSSDKLYSVSKSIREMVHFARLNLMTPWPMRGPFDIIFCRNVMIYFDKPTQGQLIERYWDLLAPGGTLFIGHSESLTGVRHKFRYIQPTVYEKT